MTVRSASLAARTRVTVRSASLVVLLGAALWHLGCATARPVHTTRPTPAPASDPRPDSKTPRPEAIPPKDDRPFGGQVLVRVALHWTGGAVEVEAAGGLTWTDASSNRNRSLAPGRSVIASCTSRSGEIRARDSAGTALADGVAALRIAARTGRLVVDGREVRGDIRISSRADSLFVVNELPLEDYLRGVVPKEIGPRPPAEAEAVAAQAVAARTYTVKRLGQYESLPFDLFADVQDQVYDGVAGEHSVADQAIRETRSLVLADERSLIETFYASTCGGQRSDIEAVWPHRASHRALRGGQDGPRGREWCRESPHFRWEENWDGAVLGALFRKHGPARLGLPAGAIRGN